ncbi:MAG: molybdenum cofactor biosynthesis protein MoaE [Myxococcales bacterium]|nr:molybdenum cofactor biosynthesis protein MoaE [Myxococcales bacterium]
MTQRSLQVQYFASARDAAGVHDDAFDFVDGESIAEFRLRLAARHPPLGRILRSCRLAQGDSFAREKDLMVPGAEIAVLPPVSGGAGAAIAPSRAQVVERVVAVGEATGLLETKGAGGICTFTGIVRDHSQGKQVAFLDYEAHVPLAEKELERIVAEAIALHGLVDARAIHRIGHLEIGEVAVDIAVSSAHRAESYEGCRHIIEELKKSVPIWKKETDTAGSSWVTPTP